MVPGKDGLVSTVTLKPQKGRLRRPVQRLHRLEASTTQLLSDEFGDSGPNGGESILVLCQNYKQKMLWFDVNEGHTKERGSIELLQT